MSGGLISQATRSHDVRAALVASAVLVGVAFAGVVVPALAQSTSPGLAPSKIAIDQPVRQGDDVRLPSLNVRNNGDETAAFGMDLLRRSEQEEMAPDRSWFEFDPERFELEPGEARLVTVVMRVPQEATPGEYLGFLRATASSAESEGAAVGVGAAVASRLTFTVENRNFHFYDPLTDFFSDRAPFSYIGLALLLLAAAIEFLRRRFRLRLSLGVERRE